MQFHFKPIAAAGGAALSLLAALVLSACGQPSAMEAPQANAGPPITAAAVLERLVIETQEFSGRIEAVEQVQIRPRVSGFIAAVNFKPGAEVKKGDVLFVIDPRPYQAEASRTEAAALAARAKADLARRELSRAEMLVADNAISKREAEEKAAAYKELEASAQAAQAAHDAAKLNLGFTRVHAPIDGRVSKAEITLGNLVDASMVLTSLVSTKSVYASFDGDEEAYLRIGAQARRGQPLTVRAGLANEEGFPHEGKLEFVDNRLDPATGSVRMRAVFKNADNVLTPGLFARVQLAPAGPGASAALVAERAVGTDQDRKFVYVVTPEGKAEYRAVRLGPVVDGMRVVREGVKPGEKVIVNGLQRVRPGAPVTAETVPMDAALTVGGKGRAPHAEVSKAASKITDAHAKDKS